MSDLNHYQRLGVDENASFEEIQDARNRLVKEHSGDRKQLEAIETAYDAILMDRLRLRQEGKIKVPDRIRFPERLAEPAPDLTPLPPPKAPGWLQKLLDTPSRADILLPAGLFAGLSVLNFVNPPAVPITLALGMGFSIYFLNRKEHKFGRAFLLTLGGLIIGVFLGISIAGLLSAQELIDQPEFFASLVTFVVLWAIDSFLR